MAVRQVMVGVLAGLGLMLGTAADASIARSDRSHTIAPRFPGYTTARSTAAPPFDFAHLGRALPAAAHRIAEASASLPPMTQLAAINARVNRVPMRDDRETYGTEDHWARPDEFFRNGGDCEDYAIAKYAILESLGWPAEAMWVVVIRETAISLTHAVLVVRHDERLWTLDNLGDRVLAFGQIDFYRPALSINRFGTWIHHVLAAALPGHAADGPTLRP